MIRKLTSFFVIAFAISSFSTQAQLTVNGSQFFIQSGAVVTVQGDITGTTDILGPGKVLLQGTANQNINMNGFTIPVLEVNNAANVTLTGDAIISTNLIFTNGNVSLGTNKLTIASSATISGFTSSKHIVTNSTGKVFKASLSNTAFTYPVGSNTTTYNPVTITNSGTADDIGVRCLSNALTNGPTGSIISKEVVAASWDISEVTPGGSNLAITTQWVPLDELPGFNRTLGGISRYDGIGWDMLNSMVGPASGSNPYTFSRNIGANLGVFAVGRRPVLITLLASPKIFLQGPYNTSLGVMNDGLRLAGLLPLNNPYDTIPGFTAAGSGGGESTTSSVFAVTGNDAIVDWVFAQLHDGSTGNVVSTRGVLLQRDGDVVETDGVTPLNFAGNTSTNYYVSIRHRNHLGVRTAATQLLLRTSSTTYDFTTAQSKAYDGGGSPPNPPMATLATNIYGMYGGNINVDRTTRKTGSATLNDYSLLLSGVNSAVAPGPSIVYRREDFNMDGNVRKTGSPTTNDYSKFLNILGVSNIITQPLF